MTGPEYRPVSSFSVTCWPGPGSTSFPQEVRPGEYGLVLRLGPVDMVITQSPYQGGSNEFVRWCRHLSRAASQVATEVELRARGTTMPRHYADEPSGQDDNTQGGESGWFPG
jgi:hypothetical protein